MHPTIIIKKSDNKFRVVNQLTNRHGDKVNIIGDLENNSGSLEQQLNDINNGFISACSDIPKRLDLTLIGVSDNSIFLKPTTANEVYNCINGLEK